MDKVVNFIRRLVKTRIPKLRSIRGTTVPEVDKEKFVKNREYCRVSFDEKAIFRLRIGECITAPGPCYILDVSAGGVKISSELILPIESCETIYSLILDFKVEEAYTLEAEIIWAETVDDRCNYGCKWVSLDDIQREQLFKELHRVAIRRRRIHL